MAFAPSTAPIGAKLDAGSVEEGRKVIEHFWRIQPTLSGLARSLTGREDITVRPSAKGTYTDNKDIYLMLNPSMVMDEAHVRNKCGMRDDDGLMVCDACKKYEFTIVNLYHEMGHIIFDSFAEVDNYRMRKFLDKQVFHENALDLSERHLRLLEKRFRLNPPAGYMESAGLISPFFPMLLNAMEDSRVNAGIISMNPGALKMFRADVVNILRGGIVRTGLEPVMWHDQPLNAQMSIGCLLVASLIDVEDGWLDPRVVDALDDAELHNMLSIIAHGQSATQTFESSLLVLKRARDLGFFLTEDDDEGDGMPGKSREAEDGDEGDEEGDESAFGGNGDDTESGDDEEGDESGGGGSSENNDSDDEDETPDEDGDGGSGDESDDDEGSDDEGDGSDDDEDDAKQEDGEPGDLDDVEFGSPEDVRELLEAFKPHDDDIDNPEDVSKDSDAQNLDKAMRQESWEKTSRQLYGLDLRKPGDRTYGTTQMSYNDPEVVADAAIIQKALGPLRVAFSENSRGHYDRNRKSGRVEARVLGRRAPVGDPRLFRKKVEPGKRDYHVVIGLDISGSTAGGGYSIGMSFIQMIKTCVLLQSEMLARIGVPFEVYAHTGGMGIDGPGYGSFDGRGSGMALNIIQIKSLEESYNKTVRERILRLKSASANFDGHTMEFYRKRLDTTAASDKLIVYYTDGSMPCENYDEELAILKRECLEIKRKKYDLLAVSIANEEPRQYGLDTVRVDVPADMQKVVLELQRKLR